MSELSRNEKELDHMGSVRKSCIAHVTSAHDPRDIRIFRKQCRSLQHHFGNVHIVAPGARDYVEDGVTVHTVRRLNSRVGRFLLTLPRIVAAAMKLNADIYHLHDPDLLLFACLLRRKGRVIFDSHEDYPRDLLSRPYLGGWLGRQVVQLYAAMEKSVFRRIDAVVVVNSAMADRIRKVQARTVTIYNFPISEDFPEPTKSAKSSDRVVWLGLLNLARGLETLKATSRLLPSGTIEVIGRCDDYDPSDSKLNVIGPMKYENAIERAANYSAGLATFPFNSFHTVMFPIKLFEYMLLGLPILASGFPKWRKLFQGTNCALFVDPASSEEIAAAIVWILEHRDEAREMGLRGRELALRKYSWSTEEAKLFALYTSVIDQEDSQIGNAKICDFDSSDVEVL